MDRLTRKLRIVILYAVLVLVLPVLSNHIFAAEVVESGICGDDISWTLDSDGNLLITGTGTIPDDNMGYYRGPWDSYSDSIVSVTIEPGITSIGDCAFKGLQRVQTVVLPDTVLRIGRYAFNYCQNLISINIPASVEEIGDNAFGSCPKLDSFSVAVDNPSYCYKDGLLFNKDMKTLNACVDQKLVECVLPETVKAINAYAFADCKLLNKVVLPNELEYIGEEAFSYCTSLVDVMIPDGVKELGRDAFVGCQSLRYISIPAEVESLGNDIFFNCTYLRRVEIPGTANRPLHYCSKLVSAVIQPGSTVITTGFFERCGNLRIVSIPKSTELIEQDAFNGCDLLSDIYYDGSEDMWNVITIQDGNDTLNNVQIHFGCREPEEGVVIASGFCGAAESLESVSYSLNDKGKVFISGQGKMGDYKQNKSPLHAYRELIDEVIIESGITHIGEYAFGQCESLWQYSIPDTLVSMGQFAFYGCDIRSVDWPSNITTIPKGCFYANSRLNHIGFSDTTKIIGRSAFHSCDALLTVDIPACVTSIGEDAFGFCIALQDIYVDSDNKQYSSIDGVLFTKDKKVLMQYPCGRVGDYTIPSGTVVIEASSFYGCETLTNITIPEGVSEIQGAAFSMCTSLERVIIPDSVVTISDSFNRCDNVFEYVVGPNNPNYCSVDGVLFTKDIKTLLRCPAKMSNYTCPKGVITIDLSAFRACYDLTEVTISNNVTTIRSGAFGGSGLERITIPHSVRLIDVEAFSYVRQLKDVYYYGTEEDWARIDIRSNNDALQSATIHYMGVQTEFTMDSKIDAKSINVEYVPKDIAITVSGDVDKAEPVLIASYDDSGRFLSLIIVNKTNTVKLDSEAGEADIFWVNNELTPKAEEIEIPLR